MAKIRQVIGGASMEAEGDELDCAEASRMFHLAVAENALRDVNHKLDALTPLKKVKKALEREIATLKTKAESTRQREN